VSDDPTKGCLSVLEAARWLNIGRTMAYSLVRNGELRTIRVGDRILVPVTELQRFIDERLAS
jgi:excisionase family DNA binding protein